MYLVPERCIWRTGSILRESIYTLNLLSENKSQNGRISSFGKKKTPQNVKKLLRPVKDKGRGGGGERKRTK